MEEYVYPQIMSVEAIVAKDHLKYAQAYTMVHVKNNSQFLST